MGNLFTFFSHGPFFLVLLFSFVLLPFTVAEERNRDGKQRSRRRVPFSASFFIFVRNLIEKNVRPFIQFRRFCYLFDKSPIIIFFNQIATKMWAGGPHRLAGSGIFLNANPRQ